MRMRSTGFDQVRRGEQSRAYSLRTQAGFDHGAHGAFAVGARHVNEPAALVWIPQRFKNRSDPFQAQLGRLDLVAERVKELNGIGVVHAESQKKRNAVEMYFFISGRGTTASSMPCLSRNSLR